MEGNSCRPDLGKTSAVPNGSSGDWRTQLHPDARLRIVNKIMDVLKRHLPASLNELQKIAMRFEEKIYAGAANQSDYLRKISLKMLSMESKSQHLGGPGQMIPSTSNNLYGNQNPVDPEMASDSDEHDEFSEEHGSSDDTSHGNDSLQRESWNSGLSRDMIARKRDASEFASGSSSRKKDKKVAHLSSSLRLLAETISLRTAAKRELQDAKKHSQEDAQKEADAYSIASCMDILNSIPDVSIKAYLAACDQFRDPAWRNMFVKMPDHRRLEWLDWLARH